jgi:hypothetical protein
MELAGRKTPARHEPSAEPPLPRSSAIAASLCNYCIKLSVQLHHVERHHSSTSRAQSDESRIHKLVLPFFHRTKNGHYVCPV